MTKEETKEKLFTLLELQNNEEFQNEILRMGQEKYQAFSNYRKYNRDDAVDSWDMEMVDGIPKICFRLVYDYDDSFWISVENLFKDTEEWLNEIKKKDQEDRERREEKERQKKIEEAKMREEWDRKEYLRLREKYRELG